MHVIRVLSQQLYGWEYNRKSWYAPSRSFAYPTKYESLMSMHGKSSSSIQDRTTISWQQRRQLNWYGHVTSSTKVILKGPSNTSEEEAGHMRGGMTTSWSGSANPSQRHNPWHTTGRSGGSWCRSPSWRAPTGYGPSRSKVTNAKRGKAL